MAKILSLVIFFGSFLGWVDYSQAQACLSLGWLRGKPYDYYAAETRQPSGTFPTGLLHMVESAHFKMNVQLLRKARSAAPGDLMFVLNSIPNHPGALDAYSRYVKKYRTSATFRAERMNKKPIYEPDCFFERALVTFPNYAETFKIWGIHLYRNQKYSEAIKRFNKAHAMGDKGADLDYFMGLTFLAVGDLEKANEHAHKAYEAGYPLQGLKNKLGKNYK